MVLQFDLIIGVYQGGSGHWAGYSTGPHCFIIMFSYSKLTQQLWGLTFNFDWLVHKVECPNVFTTNCNLQKG